MKIFCKFIGSDVEVIDGVCQFKFSMKDGEVSCFNANTTVCPLRRK